MHGHKGYWVAVGRFSADLDRLTADRAKRRNDRERLSGPDPVIRECSDRRAGRTVTFTTPSGGAMVYDCQHEPACARHDERMVAA